LTAPQRLAQAAEVRAVQPVPVDHTRRVDAHGDARGAGDDGSEELLATLRCHLLRVVQERERPDAVVAEARIVEQDAGADERTGERAATGLVRPGDEPRGEAAIEPKQPLAGRPGP